MVKICIYVTTSRISNGEHFAVLGSLLIWMNRLSLNPVPAHQLPNLSTCPNLPQPPNLLHPVTHFKSSLALTNCTGTWNTPGPEIHRNILSCSDWTLCPHLILSTFYLCVEKSEKIKDTWYDRECCIFPHSLGFNKCKVVLIWKSAQRLIHPILNLIQSAAQIWLPKIISVI